VGHDLAGDRDSGGGDKRSSSKFVVQHGSFARACASEYLGQVALSGYQDRKTLPLKVRKSKGVFRAAHDSLSPILLDVPTFDDEGEDEDGCNGVDVKVLLQSKDLTSPLSQRT
jgi:hypothetical protein